MQLKGGAFLSSVQSRDADAGLLFKKIINSINSLGTQLGADPVGRKATPPPINAINVKGSLSGSTLTAPGELLHFTLEHNQETHIGTHYISEIATNSDFIGAHVIDHGASRTHTMTLPTLLDDGITTQTYYLRSYPQLRGSLPQKPTVFGGNLAGPIAIQMSGTTAATLLPSTGSGTAPSNGSRGGSGLGKTLTGIPADTAKRSAK